MTKPTRMGSSLQGSGNLGGTTALKSARVYFQGIPSTNGIDDATVKRAMDLGAEALHISWKDTNVANVGSFLTKLQSDATAAGLRKIHATWWHEPENDNVNLVDYKNTWKQMAQAIRDAGMISTLTLMGYTLQAGSGRDYNDWYDPDSIDCLSWDMYNWGNKKQKFTDPTKMVATVAQVKADTGKPFTIAETGCTRFGTVQARADWATAWRSALEDAGASLAMWWDSGNGAFDSRLEPLSAQAWLG